MQNMIITHMLALRYIPCLMAKIVSGHIGLFIQITFIFSQLVIFLLKIMIEYGGSIITDFILK